MSSTRLKIKDGEVRPEGCICELNFRYNAKTVVYTNELEFGYTEVIGNPFQQRRRFEKCFIMLELPKNLIGLMMK